MENMLRLENIVSEIDVPPELIRGYNIRDRKMYAGGDLKKMPAIVTAHETHTTWACYGPCDGYCPSHSCTCNSYVCSSECAY